MNKTLELITESLRAAEMRQGCTNHSYYAEILYKQLFGLHQKQLNEWQLKNFGKSCVEDMIIGMVEELGELGHWILKRKQGIREASGGGDFKDEIGDAFADVVIFGIQAMSCEGINAEDVLRKTISEVLQRDFVSNPSGKGYSQHKKEIG